jgi:DNA mismatch repair protein MutL
MEHHPSSRFALSAQRPGSPWGRGGIRALPLPGFATTPVDPTPVDPTLVDPTLAYPAVASPALGGVSEAVTVPAYAQDAARVGASGGLDLGAFPAARAMPDPRAGSPAPAFPLGAAVAQVLDTYIISVAADGTLILVDQHAAHERLTHEAIRTRMLDGGAAAQPLLLPAVVELPDADVARLLARAEELARLGLEMESFGPGAVLVRALPAALGAPEPGPLVRDIADELSELDETMALSARLDAVIARMACHGSIRAGRRLGQAEMDALLRQMEATPRAATCSHGRPTFLRLSKAEIETMFGRR